MSHELPNDLRLSERPGIYQNFIELYPSGPCSPKTQRLVDTRRSILKNKTKGLHKVSIYHKN